MTDRPIIFSGPMVRALLSGSKTQTRRLAWKRKPDPADDKLTIQVRSPWRAVKPGDRLWVRENIRACDDPDDAVIYLADSHRWTLPETLDGVDAHLRLRGYGRGPTAASYPIVPSIHMPRWASRITLHVDAVRVERLQDISEADAKAEGAQEDYPGRPYWSGFILLWDRLHGPGAWENNPDVVALTFRVAKGNIDE